MYNQLHNLGLFEQTEFTLEASADLTLRVLPLVLDLIGGGELSLGPTPGITQESTLLPTSV